MARVKITITPFFLMQIGLWCGQSLFFQFLLLFFFLSLSRAWSQSLLWPMEALKYESMSFDLLNNLSQLAMETAIVSMIWTGMWRLVKTLLSSYWKILPVPFRGTLFKRHPVHLPYLPYHWYATVPKATILKEVKFICY